MRFGQKTWQVGTQWRNDCIYQRHQQCTLLPFGSGYDFSEAANTSSVTGGKYIYHVCRVLHRPGLWHYGKVRENETQCMFAGNAKVLGVTSGYQVLVMN